MVVIEHTIEDFVMATGMPVEWYLKGAEQNIGAHRKCAEANRKNGVKYTGDYWIERAQKQLHLALKALERDKNVDKSE